MSQTKTRPSTRWKALKGNILVVAKFTFGDRWKAFIDTVPGRSHEHEWEMVLDNGTMLDEDVAKALFPAFAGYSYDY